MIFLCSISYTSVIDYHLGFSVIQIITDASDGKCWGKCAVEKRECNRHYIMMRIHHDDMV